MDRMCDSEHEECGEARGPRYGGSQSCRPGAIGMPLIVRGTDTAKPLTLNNLEATNSWRQTAWTRSVSHICAVSYRSEPTKIALNGLPKTCLPWWPPGRCLRHTKEHTASTKF